MRCASSRSPGGGAAPHTSAQKGEVAGGETGARARPPPPPHGGAACAATEAPLPAVALDLLELGPWDGLDDVARRVVDVVVTAEEAGVVVGDLLRQLLVRLQGPLLEELRQHLGVVVDLEATIELGVLVLD